MSVTVCLRGDGLVLEWVWGKLANILSNILLFSLSLFFFSKNTNNSKLQPSLNKVTYKFTLYVRDC
jgi:hypothetical protein